MHLKTLLIASLVGATVAVPVISPEGKAVINTRFVTYGNEARDAAPESAAENAVINTRFVTYDAEGLAEMV